MNKPKIEISGSWRPDPNGGKGKIVEIDAIAGTERVRQIAAAVLSDA